MKKIFYGIMLLAAIGCHGKVYEERIDCNATVVFYALQDDYVKLSEVAQKLDFWIPDDEIGENYAVSIKGLKNGFTVVWPKSSTLGYLAVANWPGDIGYWQGGNFTVPNGDPFPFAYGEYREIDITNEDYQSYGIRAIPLYSKVDVSISGDSSAGGRISVESDFGGYQNPRLEPMTGEYVYGCAMGVQYTLAIPRVKDFGSVITLEYKGGTYSLNVNGALSKMGYQANEDALVSVGVAYRASAGKITGATVSWEGKSAEIVF